MPQGTAVNCKLCDEQALSFSDACWDHSDHKDYLERLSAGLATTDPAKPSALHLKKVRLAEIDFSNRDLTGSSFTQSHLADCNFVGSALAETDFIGSKLQRCEFVGADLRCANLTKADSDHSSFSYADLRGARLSECRLRETDFIGATTHGAVLWNADLSGAKHLKKKNFQDPDSKSLRRPTGVSERDALVACETYRILKHHFHARGYYEDGSWAAYRELTMERKHYAKTRDPRFIPSFFMNLLSGYTEKPNRVIIASFAIVVAFAALYYALNAAYPAGDPTVDRIGFGDSLYFSFITFTTVGYGDFAPRPVFWFRLLACAEAFSGPFMAGLYIFTLTRRYAAG